MDSAIGAQPLPLVTSGRKTLLRHALDELRSAFRARELTRHLVVAALKREHVGAVLGSVWWMLDPLLMVGIYVIVIHVMLGRGGHDFPIYLFCALVIWKYFTASVKGAMSMTVGRLTLMRRVPFPRVLLPAAAVLAETVRLAFALGVLLVFAAVFGVYPTVYVPLAVFPILVTLVLALGLGYLLAAANVFVRDVDNVTTHAFRILFYLSPALYQVQNVPARYRRLYTLNPFATIYGSMRDSILYHRLPGFGALGAVALFALALLCAGYLVFVRLQTSFTKISS